MTDAPPSFELPTFTEDVRASVTDETDAFDTFESTLSEFIPRFTKARAAARYEERRFRETGVLTARRQGTHVLTSTAIRALDFGAGVIEAVNARRAHPAYASARALVETTASLSYMDQEVLPRLAKGRKEQVDEQLRRLRLGLDPGVGFGPEFDVRPIPVSSMIKALKRQADAALERDGGRSAGETISSFYSLITDHAHPNGSAQHLSSYFDDEEMMDWRFNYEWSRSSIHDVLGVTYLALHFGGEAFDRFLRAVANHPLDLT